MKVHFLLACAALLVSCQGQSKQANPSEPTQETASDYKVTKTDAGWRASRTPQQYLVLRKAGTENPGSSDLLYNKQEGTYVCAGCGTPVFESAHKFDSGTGWPSFDREIEGNVAFTEDRSYGMVRIEEHCATCGGHLGHVFDDGPRQTTGMRHCISGAALNFVPVQ